MTNPSKAKGTAWETAVVKYIRDIGLHAKRRPLTGHLDEGDIEVEGIPWLTIEAKAGKKMDLAGWITEANIEALNAHCSVGAVWAKRRGKTSPADGYVILDGESFMEILSTITGLHETLFEAEIRGPLQ